MNRTTTLTIRISKKLKKEINFLCEDFQIHSNDLILEALKYYLPLARFKKLRAKILPHAEQAGIHSDEDVFKCLS